MKWKGLSAYTAGPTAAAAGSRRGERTWLSLRPRFSPRGARTSAQRRARPREAHESRARTPVPSSRAAESLISRFLALSPFERPDALLIAAAAAALVLLQHIARTSTLPLWLRGGVGLHTTAAAFAGGAFGVVLDAALALGHESHLDEPLRCLVATMDGSETTVHGGLRVLARPELGGSRRDFGNGAPRCDRRPPRPW